MRAATKLAKTDTGLNSLRNPLPRPSWLSTEVWPFETYGLETADGIIAVTDVGRGPVLLFVHTGFWSFIWRDVLTLLSKDFRCIAFDAPGTGRSYRPPLSEIGLSRAARVVSEIIEQLELSELTLVFHDLGGPTAIAGVAALADRINGLAAVNTFAWTPSGAMFRGMLALMGSVAMREFDVLTRFLPRISATYFGAGRHMDRASRRAFVSGIGRDGLRAFHSYLRDARRAQSIYSTISSALEGPLKSLPLLTIFGERNDPLGFQPHWKKLFPDARQVVVPKGNHFPMCDDPELVASSIRSWHRERIAQPGI